MIVSRRVARRLAGVAGCLALLLAGCGKSDRVVKVKGRVIKGGSPVTVNTEGLPPGDRGLRVGFIRVGADKPEEFYATVDPAAGTFEVPGQDGNGIPPGRYQITVEMGAVGAADQLKGKFDRGNSKIERDVDGKQEIVIDLDKPEG